ncbi:MAG: TolC family protein [Oligoflexia bacterium]|nr:TolC family protein [Oligoflexia bacterium]
MKRMNVLFLGVLLFCVHLCASAEEKIAEKKSLKDCLLLALQNNFDLKLEASSLEQKKQGITSSQGDFDPLLTANYSYSDSTTPSSSSLDGVGSAKPIESVTSIYKLNLSKKFTFGTELTIPYTETVKRSNSTYNIFGKSYNPNLGFTLKQPLILGFYPSYHRKNVTSAELEFQKSNEDQKIKMSDTMLKVATTFLDVVKFEKELEIKTSSFKSAEDNLQFVKKKQDIGMASAIDIAEAKSKYLQKQEGLIEAKKNLEEKRGNLLLLIYGDIENSILVNNDLDQIKHEIAEKSLEINADQYSEFLEIAMKNRSEILKANYAIEKATFEKECAGKDLLPKNNATYNESWQGMRGHHSDAFDEVKDRKFKTTSLQIEVESPLFRHASKSAYEMKNLQWQQEQLKQKKVINEVSLEIFVLLKKIESEKIRIQALAEALAAESIKYDGQKQSYHLGKISLSDFNQAIEDKEKSELENLKAKISHLTSLLNLYKSQGVIFQKLAL